MRIKCEFCGAWMEDTDERCAQCGSVNAHFRAQFTDQPRTIAELQAWYEARELPPMEVTRFFIGIDTDEAKAFGIFRSGDTVTVYKNKSDGSRAVRYSGPDEAYAVGEIYMKLKEEILHQKEANLSRSTPAAGPIPRSQPQAEPQLPYDPDAPLTLTDLEAWYKGQAQEGPIRLIIGSESRQPGTVSVFEYRGDYTARVTTTKKTTYVAYSGISEARAAYAAYQQYQALSAGQEDKVMPAEVKQQVKQKKTAKNIFLVVLLAIIAIAGFGAQVEKSRNETLGYNQTVLPRFDSYYVSGESLWYYDSQGTWWRYDPSAQDYVAEVSLPWPNDLEGDRVDPADYFPSGVAFDQNGPIANVSDLAAFDFLHADIQTVNRKYNILHSRNYIAANGHPTPDQGYYALEDQLYYYLPSWYPEDGQDQFGWFRREADSWTFFATENNLDRLGEELWLEPDVYYVEKPSEFADMYTWAEGQAWQVDESLFTFEQTPAYRGFESAQSQYYERIFREAEERESSDYWSSSDSDYSWSSNDSWDSGFTDWDSDW